MSPGAAECSLRCGDLVLDDGSTPNVASFAVRAGVNFRAIV